MPGSGTKQAGEAAAPRYPRALQVLHWSIALLVGVQIALILVLRQLQSLDFGRLVLAAHRQCGALVLILIAARLILALRLRVPKSDARLPPWQSLAAHGAHLVMTLALLVQPVLGFLVAWSRGDDVALAGVLKIPALVRLSNAEGMKLEAAHRWTATALLALVAVHVLAVAFNRLARKVSVIERMLPERADNRLTNRIPMAAQLAFCCGAILAMSTAAGLYGASQYKAFNDVRAKFDDTEVAVLDDMRTAQVALKGLAPALPASAQGSAADAASTLAAFPGRLADPEARSAASKAAAALGKLAAGDHSQSTFDLADQQLQSAVDSQYLRVFQRRQEIGEIAAKGHDLIILALAPSVMLGAVLAFLLSRSVLTALGQARKVVQGVEAGEGAGVVRVDGGGEFANLMRDILAMRDAVAARQAEAADRELRQREAVDVLAREQREREGALARRLTAEQGAIVQALDEALAALAAGDLSHRIDQPFPGDYDRIRVHFNDAISALAAAMHTISTTAGSLGTSSQEIASAASELAQRTERQAASLGETATALDVITHTVKTSADGARQAAEIVTAARAQADQSSTIVSDAIRAVGDIKASSGQIGQIVGVIDEIAFQTNLLALNAGVEAARAGDSGRGFAVVALEVRALAQRSAEAAKEIKALISASTHQVSAGVELVARTGDALQNIVAKVGEIDALVASIASSARAQAAGLEDVNGAVTQMDHIVQQNAAMVEEATAAAQLMNADAGTLGGLMRQFKVGGAEDAPSVRLKRASA